MRTELALDILKLVLLAALYLFFARVLWAVWSEVRTDRRVVASHTVDERSATRAAPVPKPRKAQKGRGGRVGRMVVLEPKAKRGTTFALNGNSEVTIGREVWRRLVAIGSGTTAGSFGAGLGLDEQATGFAIRDLVDAGLV